MDKTPPPYKPLIPSENSAFSKPKPRRSRFPAQATNATAPEATASGIRRPEPRSGYDTPPDQFAVFPLTRKRKERG
jgi:hypothetical protein